MSQVKTIKFISLFTIIIAGLFCFCSSADALFLEGWNYRQEISIDPAVVDDDLTNFPVAAMFSSTTFDYTHAQENGDDMRFTSSDGETLIDFEREIHSTLTDSYVYWVEVPLVSSSTVATTTFYMYYGNSVASDAASSTAVWDADFKGVWHLKDDPDTSHIQDSTTNNNDGTKRAANEPVEADAKIAKGQDFDGVDDDIDLPNNASLQTDGSLTIESWVNFTTIPSVKNEHECIIKRGDAENTTSFRLIALTNDRFNFLITTADGNFSVTCDTVIANSTWYFLAFTYDLSYLRGYINGAEDCLAASSTSTLSNATGDKDIGNWDEFNTNRDLPTEGKIDEVRWSDVAHSSAWIKASYNSGANTLLTFGSEESEAVRRIFLIQ